MPFDSKYKSFLINIRDSIRGKSGEIFNTVSDLTDQTRLFEWVGPALLNFGLTDKISIMKTSKFKILSFLYHLHKVANEMEWGDGCYDKTG